MAQLSINFGRKQMRKQETFKNTPMVTGQLNKELGIQINKEFIKRNLRIKPLLETKTTAYWDDVGLIKQRLGIYFT
jgi:hypothetical protein